MLELTHTVTIPAPVAPAWAVLDALVTDGFVEGELALRVGPVTRPYRGSVRVVTSDAAERTLGLTIDAAEVGGAARFLASSVVALHDGNRGTTTAVVRTHAEVAGRLAMYGEAVVDDLVGRQLRLIVDALTATGFPDGDDPVVEEPMPVFRLEASPVEAKRPDRPLTEPEPDPAEDASLAAKAAPYAIVLLLLWLLRRMFGSGD